ncbi:hypothetical protein [Paraliomyxa miuraensis]|uniref:hypothetical protein n=1 Tax=Paraliomyxa miuraensis TaxID=376150 RepID=UPI002257ECA1|nr:hypothetical protein [Paraliomyxa miuraensis]MCX4246832.1 hypothetical protein [Paraliomyxa miuraensis]
MTHEETHESSEERGEPTSLPFEYEDRTDGSYARALEEVRAAWLWTKSRRARGLLPN